MADAGSKPLLQVDNLTVRFPVKRGGMFGGKAYLYAVDDISFEIKRGETLAIVGESGSGKTTAALAVRAPGPGPCGQRHPRWRGFPRRHDAELRKARAKVQFIFQDPYSSLNPRLRAEKIVREPLDSLDTIPPTQRDEVVRKLFKAVGLRPEQMRLFPHQFSGGQRQRIGIARALATQPALVICDEPVSALDVAVQAQILNLLRDLQGEFGLTYLFISHDLGVVQHMCDTIAVMYMGKIVEHAPRIELFNTPLHPYTKALLSAVPSVDKARRERKNASSSPATRPTRLTRLKGAGLRTGARLRRRGARRRSHRWRRRRAGTGWRVIWWGERFNLSPRGKRLAAVSENISRPPRHPALTPFIKMLWSYQSDTDYGLDYVVPNGRLQLLINLHENQHRLYSADGILRERFSGLCIQGPTTRRVVIDTANQKDIVGVTFHPGASMPIFAVQEADLANSMIDLEDVWPKGAQTVYQRVSDASHNHERLDVLEACLLQQLAYPSRQVAVVQHASWLLSKGQSVRAVASAVDMPSTSFTGLFRKYGGMAPKTFARIERMQRLMKMLDNGDSWSELAYDNGYSDQAHMIREFRSFSGVSPTRYRPRSARAINHSSFEPG